ncbi:glycosyltransferase, partial [uncultured Porphyromonas sp.]|uniref:glycosyltransferase n=1 Tax=uncultured Porphyromonas sp. TaxID=159274 RepID=UPI00263140C7
PDWTLEIIGNGPDKSRLQKLINTLHLQDKVTLTPATPYIQAKYLDASIYAMTSRYEGLPMVLLEAQAYGLPIISYDCKCGPKDIISDEVNGFIIPMKNHELFVQRLLTLMQDQSLRERMSIQSVIASRRYDEELIMNQWITLFEKLLHE